MSCNPCAPKAIVTCLAGAPGDKYLFHIHGLETGDYFWRLEDERGNVFSKAFTYTGNPYVGDTVEIGVADVPAGLFTTERKVWFSITKDIGGLTKVPFLFAQYVDEVAVEIVCDEFQAEKEEIGIQVVY